MTTTELLIAIVGLSLTTIAQSLTLGSRIGKLEQSTKELREDMVYLRGRIDCLPKSNA